MPHGVIGQDDERPISPLLKLVTVDPLTGKASLEWDLSPSPDVAAYIIYINKNNSWIAIDTVWDPMATTYLNASSNADFFPESYVIAAFDSAANPSPLTDPQTTIFNSLSFDSCLVQINLDWTPYTGWEDNLENYEIILSIDGGPDSLMQTINRSITEYVHQDIKSYKNYCYYIKAKNSEGLVSTSNKICLFTQMAIIPEYINADFATVVDNNQVHLSFSIDPDSEIYKFRLLKGLNPLNINQTVSTFLDPPSWKIEYTDMVEDVTMRYYYKLVALNACDSIVRESNIGSNIVLNVENRDVINNLNWTAYDRWIDDVESYEIYRIIEDELPELVGSAEGTDTAYADDISSLQYTVVSGKFCYYVLASEGDMNPYGVKGIAQSNTSCGIVPVHVFIPNAFTPNSDNKNDIFIPVLSFTPRQYHFTIQNRWGNLIFESKDPLVGWDGTIKKERPAPAGVYIYYLRIITDEGEVIKKNGHVTLVYPK
jgi:gliding motility-associated-like protein